MWSYRHEDKTRLRMPCDTYFWTWVFFNHFIWIKIVSSRVLGLLPIIHTFVVNVVLGESGYIFSVRWLWTVKLSERNGLGFWEAKWDISAKAKNDGQKRNHEKVSNPTSLYYKMKPKLMLKLNRYQSNYSGYCQNCSVMKSLVFSHVVNQQYGHACMVK